MIEPAPELTFTMRGVDRDFDSSGAKASTVAYGPAAFVLNILMSLWNMRSSLLSAIPALLTKASSLGVDQLLIKQSS